MRTFILSLITVGSLLLFTAESPAHNALPTVQWCSAGTPTPVAEFKFYPAMLIAVREAAAASQTSAAGGDQGLFDHGIFDDDYDIGKKTSSSHCNQFATAGEGDIGSVLPLIELPQTYLQANHHEAYTLDQGLSGTCVRCQAPASNGPRN